MSRALNADTTAIAIRTMPLCISCTIASLYSFTAPCNVYYTVYSIILYSCLYASPAPLHHCTTLLHPAIYIIQYYPVILPLCISCTIASLYNFTAPCNIYYTVLSCNPAFMHLLHHCIIVQLYCTLQYILYSIIL